MTTTTAAEAAAASACHRRKAADRGPVALNSSDLMIPRDDNKTTTTAAAAAAAVTARPPNQRQRRGGDGAAPGSVSIPPAIVAIPLPRDMATVVLAIEASPSRRGVSVVGSVAGGGRRDKGQQGGEGLTNGRRGRGE